MKKITKVLSHTIMASALATAGLYTSSVNAATLADVLKVGTVEPVSAKSNVLSVETLTQLNQLHNLAVSPDGQWAVYGVKEGFVSSNNHLYLHSLKDNEVRQLTSHNKSESNVVFAQDSQSIYFLSSRSGSSQIWQLPLFGGEAKQVSFLPVDINGFKISQDGKQFALSITTFAGCTNFECIKTAKQEAENEKHNTRVYDQLMVRHWDHWLDRFNEHIFLGHVNSKNQLTNAQDIIANWKSDIAGIGQVAFHPDGKSLVFSAKAPSKDQAWTTNFDIFQWDISKQTLTNLTETNTAWDAKPVFSPNGRYLAYLAMAKPGYESDKFAIKVIDNNTGQVKSVASQWDRSVSELVFADDNRTLYATAQDIGQKSIFEIHPEFGDVRAVYSTGTNGDIHVVDNTIYFTRHTLNAPKDLFKIARDGYGLTQLTTLNKDKLANIYFGNYEQFDFKGWNGEKVYGYWMKPANYQSGKKYPVAFLVHGGPQGSFGNMFHYRWNAQLWAAQGYGVVMIDFHGSTGYGQAFTDSIARDWGGKPLEDLQKGLDFIVKQQPWLDRQRTCALGASYGGYMMNWIAGNWSDGFNCLVNHAGLFDMPSFYGSTEELWFPEHDLGGEVWKQGSDYQKFNPAAFVENWKTPMLVIQGELDYRVPYAQSLGAFTALQRQGIESRLVMFPDEDHHIRKPDNLIKWYQEVFAWLNKYTN
ncbi:S9 family peptidase [Thalassotalea fusca]